MKLRRIRIKTFRSIVDTGIVEIDEGVTVLIGKNEQGKTNFLKGIRAFNPDQRFTPKDLPNHMRASLDEKKPEEIDIVTAWFVIEPGDRSRLASSYAGIDKAAEIKCIKTYGNSFKYWLIDRAGTESPLKHAPPDLSQPVARIKKAVEELKVKFEAHSTRVPSFAGNSEKIDQITSAIVKANWNESSAVDNLIKTFTVSIKNLTGQDQPITDDITLALKELDTAREEIHKAFQQDRSRELWSAFPIVILHSTTSDRIPNEVSIAEFVANADATSRGMANLCNAAGLSVQKIKELAATAETAEIETFEDHYKGTISGGLNEFWTQERYTVHFRIGKEKLSVSISDQSYTQRIPPSDRSEGFQWYLSFYATLLNDVDLSKPTVLLLDNPGLELHLDGQRDIKRFLEEKVARNSQVLYVTHSPAMVDPFNLGQVRTVELLPNQQGTKVSAFKPQTHEKTSDLLEPVRSAIGMSLVSSLIFNKKNVLVEGAADKPIVEGIFVSHYKDKGAEITVNGSLAESKDAFLAMFYHRTGLPYAILLDADSGGRDLFNELTSAGIPANRIVRLNDVFPGKAGDFATEDVLSREFYHQAVREAYPGVAVVKPAPQAQGKICKQYEEQFKTLNIGFNKRRVADAAKKLLAEGKEDQATRDALGTLSTAIVSTLEGTRLTVAAAGPPADAPPPLVAKNEAAPPADAPPPVAKNE